LIVILDPQYRFGCEFGVDCLAQTGCKKPEAHSPEHKPFPDQEDDSRSAVENEKLNENRKDWEGEHQQDDHQDKHIFLFSMLQQCYF
jgi:hypothetical protein